MTVLKPSLTRERYPIRYWSLLVFIIGFPNFLAFDSTGLTHNNGLFNITSIMSIIITMSTGIILVMMTFLTRSAVIQRPLNFPSTIWLLLLANFALSSVLQPSVIASHLVKQPITDQAISFYRLAEWILAFIVIFSLVSRESKQTAGDMTVRVIGIVCWFKIILIWIMLPIAHKLVYAADHESDSAIDRLGGTMVNPVHLGIFAAIAFFYNMMFVKSRRLRIGGCLLAVATLGLTYSRSIQIIFLGLLLMYMLLSPRPRMKYLGMLTAFSGALGAIVLSDKIVTYLGRGHGTGNITSLSERTLVWQASEKVFWMRPWLGYGYISGPKRAIAEEWLGTNWLPPHAHSDYLQSFLSGGFLAGFLMILVYLVPLVRSLRRVKEGPVQVFLLITFLMITGMSVIIVILSTQFTDLGGVFLLTYIGIVATPKISTSKARSFAATPIKRINYQLP